MKLLTGKSNERDLVPGRRRELEMLWKDVRQALSRLWCRFALRVDEKIRP